MHGYAAMVKRKFNISSRQERAKKTNNPTTTPCYPNVPRNSKSLLPAISCQKHGLSKWILLMCPASPTHFMLFLSPCPWQDGSWNPATPGTLSGSVWNESCLLQLVCGWFRRVKKFLGGPMEHGTGETGPQFPWSQDQKSLIPVKRETFCFSWLHSWLHTDWSNRWNLFTTSAVSAVSANRLANGNWQTENSWEHVHINHIGHIDHIAPSSRLSSPDPSSSNSKNLGMSTESLSRTCQICHCKISRTTRYTGILEECST